MGLEIIPIKLFFKLNFGARIITIQLNKYKIKEYQNNLEHETTLIPVILLSYIDNAEYIHNLKQTKKWDNVKWDIFTRRRKLRKMTPRQKEDYTNKELYHWLQKHEQYQDIIKKKTTEQ